MEEKKNNKKNNINKKHIFIIIIVCLILVIVVYKLFLYIKKNSLIDSSVTHAKDIVKKAQTQWVIDSSNQTSNPEIEYGNCQECSYKALAVKIPYYVQYYVKVNKDGNVSVFAYDDCKKRYIYSGKGLNINNIRTENFINSVPGPLLNN